MWHQPYEKDGKTIIAVAYNYQGDVRITALSKEGESVSSSSSTHNVEGFSGMEARFYLPLDKIREFQFQVRPYQWVEFKNVSLRPEVKTDLQVEEVEPDSEYMFGPVIDCVVHAVDAEKDSFVDLDTGKAFSSEKIGTKDREELFRAKGIDISILIINSALKWIDGDILLGCYDMIAVGLKKKEWETITPIEVTQKIETGQRVPNRGLPVKSIAGALSPSVYAIGTSEGGMGIIQILGFADNPKRIKIRYKMVQKAPGWKTDRQVEVEGR